jgi:hypothetical protein
MLRLAQRFAVHVKEPDILLLPVLLPLFLLGSVPLLLLAFLGYGGLGLAGLLMLLAAQRNEFDAHDDIIRHAITDGVQRPTERAVQRTDMLAAVRLAYVLRIAGIASIICAAIGLYTVS